MVKWRVLDNIVNKELQYCFTSKILKMPVGITKINGIFETLEYESYDDEPPEIVLKHPPHNSNIYLIEPVIYNLTDDIDFSWCETWVYKDPPFLYIRYKINSYDDDKTIVEYLRNATIENVVLKLNEYVDMNVEDLLKKRIKYLEKSIDKEEKEANKKYEVLQNEYKILEAKISALQKSYDDLFTLLKNK